MKYLPQSLQWLWFVFCRTQIILEAKILFIKKTSLIAFLLSLNNILIPEYKLELPQEIKNISNEYKNMGLYIENGSININKFWAI